MAEKKIADVKHADKVAPSASSRPIVVTDRPVVKRDPMVVSETAPATAPVLHTAKVIQPIEVKAQPVAAETDVPSEVTVPAPSVAETEPAPPVTASEPEQAPVETTGVSEDIPEPGPERDSEAATSAAAAEADEARQARVAELERLVASGKYAVPINAVGRKRSRMVAVVAIFVVLLAAVATADILLDLGTVKAPSSVPHTHLFSKN